MKHTVACGFLVLLSLVFVFRISSQEIQTHRSKVTVPILENDIAYAKNNAFQTLQKHLLSLAIKDLIGDLLYDEYRKQILLNESLNPKYYLVSVKVLKEHSGAGSFTMELEGKIQMDILAEALRKMNLVFKSDSWVPVSLVVEDGIDISMEDFESRLGLFHLKIDEADTIDFSEFPWDEYPSRDRADKEFIEKLFEQYSGNKIVYLIEAERYNAYSEVFGDVFADPYSFETDNAVGDIQALRLKILRKSDLEQVNALSMKISPPISPKSEDFNDRLNRVFQKFLALLSIQSLKKSSYDVGTGSIINLEIVGLATPLHRSFFEEEILKRNRSVKFFLLTKLSTHSIQYKIRSKISLPSLIEDFREENPYFDFEVESDEFNTLKLLAIGKPTENASDMPDWEPKTDIIIGIGKAILNKSSFMEKAMIRTDLSEEDIPLLVEKEPNNSSRTFNKLPPSMLAVGRIDRRGDEDIYQLEGLPQKPELEIDDQSQDYVDLFEPRFPNFSLEIAVSDQEIAGQEGIETLKDIGIKEDPTGDQEIENEEDRIKEDPTGDQEIENEEDRIKEDPTGDQKIENEEGRIKEDPTGDQKIEKEEGRIKEDPTGDQEIENEEGVDASIDIEKKKANETRFEAEVEKTKDEERKPSYADIAYSELQPIIDLLEITENTLFLEDKKYPMFGEEPFDRQQKPPKESTIHIDWIRVGRTTLNPQLRLYDENFDFINVFSLIGFQNKLSFSHTFHGDPPQKIYLRISDKIGFIPGETGGVKYFDYLIKYYWEPEPEPDMEMALDMYMDTTPDADTAPDMYMDTTPEREEGVSPSP